MEPVFNNLAFRAFLEQTLKDHGAESYIAQLRLIEFGTYYLAITRLFARESLLGPLIDLYHYLEPFGPFRAKSLEAIMKKAGFCGDLSILRHFYPLASDKSRYKSLNWACFKGHRAVVDEILSYGLPVSGSQGFDALLDVCRGRSCLGIANALMVHGANPHYPDAPKPLLYHAVALCNWEFINFVLGQGVDPNEATSKGKTALNLAINRETSYIVKLLLENGADPNLSNQGGATPLSAACAIPEPIARNKIVDLLLLHGAQLNFVPRNFYTPLDTAIRGNYLDLVHKFIAAGANVNLRGSDGLFPLERAKNMGHAEIADVLRQHHAVSSND